MRKLLIALVAAAALTIATAAQTQACSTHGYVRASTLNDLFHGTGGFGNNTDPNGLEFEADNGGGLNNPNESQAANALGDAQLFAHNGGHYDDGHDFGWRVNGGAWQRQGMGSGTPGQQLNGIISSIEQAISENSDVAFTD